MPIINKGDSYSNFESGVIIIKNLDQLIFGSELGEILGYVGYFQDGPIDEKVIVEEYGDVTRIFSDDIDYTGNLDMEAIFRQRPTPMKILGVKGGTGTPVKATKTFTDKPFASLTVKDLGDTEDIITFTADSYGPSGNSITVEIVDGVGSTKNINIVRGSTVENYTNLDMDETVTASYIVDVINGASSLVTVTRVSALSTDSLPKNISATPLSGGALTDVFRLDAKVAGLDGNNIYTTIIENGTTSVTMTIVDLSGVVPITEVYTSVDMDETVPATYLIDRINNESNLVDAVRLTLTTNDVLPIGVSDENLQGGSNGQPVKSYKTVTDSSLNNVLKVQHVYYGKKGDEVLFKIEDGTEASTFRFVVVKGQQREEFDNLDMVVTSDNYAVDVVNNVVSGSKFVTLERLSLITNLNFPENNDYVNLENGNDGDPPTETDILNALDEFKEDVDISGLTVGSHGTGTNDVISKKVKEVIKETNDILGFVSGDEGDDGEYAKALAKEMNDINVNVSYPWSNITTQAKQKSKNIAPSIFTSIFRLNTEPQYLIQRASIDIVNKFAEEIGNTRTQGKLIGFSKAGVTALGYSRGDEGNSILNDYMSDGNTSSRAAMFNYLARKLERGLASLVAKPNTKNLAQQAKSRASAILRFEYNSGRIGDNNNDGEEFAYVVNIKKSENKNILQLEIKVVLFGHAKLMLVDLSASPEINLANK